MKEKLNNTEKVLEILKAFLPDNCPRGTVELSQDLGLDPATVSRILKILKKYDFVQQKDGKKYQLGPVAEEIGNAVSVTKASRILDVVKPSLMTLNDILNESVHFEILDRDDIKLALVLSGSKTVKISEAPPWEERSRINSSAGAKAILAFLDQQRFSHIKEAHSKLSPNRKRTTTDWSSLEKQFDEIQKTGLAFEYEEHVEGVCAVATPVFDLQGDVFGAVTVPVPLQRKGIISEQRNLTLLKETAKKITEVIASLR